jgi:alanine racemase
MDQIAEIVGTINYEIVAGLSRRIPRMFVRAGEIVAIEDLHGYRQFPSRGHINN